MNNLSLENYKKRNLKRLWPKTFDTIAIFSVVAIIDVLVKWLHADISDNILIIVSLAIIVFAIYFFRTRFFEKLKPKEFFSAGFDFRQPDDETIAAAIEGIFSFSKSLQLLKLTAATSFIYTASPVKENLCLHITPFTKENGRVVPSATL